MISGCEEIHDLDGGNITGFLLYGDVDHDDIEAFMGSAELADAFYDGGPVGGFEVTECWVRKVPIRGGENEGWSRYVYTDTPGPGARKCVRIEEHTSWGRWCMNHIYEPATTGISVERITDPIWPIVLTHIISPEARAARAHWRGPMDGLPMVYLCADCARSFREREQRATDERMRAFYLERGDTDAVARIDARLAGAA